MTTSSGGFDDSDAGGGAAPGGIAVGFVAPEAVLSDPAICARYRVVETIAPGPEDALYLARRLDTGALVELRVLSGGLGGDRVLMAALVQHATLVARVSGQCPGIAALHECERTQSGLVLVMEHPEGPTLREVIKREGTLGLKRALGLALGLAKVLERVHNLGLVHGGLRPEHVVLVGPEEEVVLTHFGFDWVLLSRSPDAEGRRASAADDPPYRAPEQAWDQTDPRSDIYAFGAIVYEMLAGTPPPASVASRPRVNPEPLRNCRADVTPGLERIVTQALQVAPERRPADMSVVVNALSAETSADRPPTSAEDRTVADPSARTRMKKSFGWGGVTVLGVLVLCAIWFAYARVTPGRSSSRTLPQATSSPASVPGTAPDEAPVYTAPADTPDPGVAHRATDDSLAPREAASSPPPMASRTPQAERAPDASHDQKPRAGLPSGPAAVIPPRPAAVTQPKPAESPAMTTRTDDVATSRRPAESAAPRPQGSRETGEAGDDPGAIIDWLVNEGAGKEH